MRCPRELGTVESWYGAPVEPHPRAQTETGAAAAEAGRAPATERERGSRL